MTETESTITSSSPIPARMINETLYCERLVHLEWCQSEFTDNAFTIDGRHVHRRADSPTGDLPPTPSAPAASTGPAGGYEERDDDRDSRPYQAKSLWLTSERLGITAKIDVVEGDADGRVIPIEYKRGKRPDVPEGAYLPERAQLCAHVLLLREHGYACTEAAIYFAGDHRRTAITIDEDLERTTLAAVARAREILALPKPPPPLVDSPKCFGCSLVSICLPDESNRLRTTPEPAAAPTREVRRMFPARDESTPVYVQEHGAVVGKRGDVLDIKKNGQSLAEAPILKTSHLALFGNATVTTPALQELASRGVPICHFTAGNWFHAITHGMPSRNVGLRVRQFAVAANATASLVLARQFIEGKIRNARTLLQRNARDDVKTALRELRTSAARAKLATSVESLLGIEGSAARSYFQAFSKMLRPASKDGVGTFDFSSRNRRPPRDPVNALLSFLYAILAKDLTVTLMTVGFDPYLGFMHTAHHGRPSLALDLAEEFRPVIADSVVVGLVNTDEIQEHHFVRRLESTGLTPEGRKVALRAYERRMDTLITHPIFGYSLSYRRVLEVQARLLARAVVGEIPAYPAFRTR